MAKAVGFTLAEIKEVVDAWYKKQISKKAKIQVLDKKLLQIEEKIKELKSVKKQIAICKFNIENENIENADETIISGGRPFDLPPY